MKNNAIIVVFLIILNLLVLGAFGFWFYTEKFAKPSPTPTPTATVQPETTAVPALQPTVAPTLMPTPTPQPKSDLQMLKEAFAAKYSKPVSDTDVTINKNTGTYASGLIKFAGEMGGGWWLAYNDGAKWIIVADGNGTVPCEPIGPYNFPVDMVPECWDEATNTLITR